MTARKATRRPKAQTFHIGDIAVIVYNRSPEAIYSPGMEVRIVEGLERRKMDGDDGEVINCYGILGVGFNERDHRSRDYIRYCVPDQLKKQGRENPSKIIRWHDCPWRPRALESQP